MNKYLIAAFAFSGLSALSLALSVTGVITAPSPLAFNKFHASIAVLAGLVVAALVRFPSSRGLGGAVLSLVAFTFGLGLLELAFAVSAILDGRSPNPNGFPSGVGFLAQALCSFRGLRLRAVFGRYDSPSGPGPLSPA